jgi:hypothetical protein
MEGNMENEKWALNGGVRPKRSHVRQKLALIAKGVNVAMLPTKPLRKLSDSQLAKRYERVKERFEEAELQLHELRLYYKLLTDEMDKRVFGKEK